MLRSIMVAALIFGVPVAERIFGLRVIKSAWMIGARRGPNGVVSGIAY